MKEQGAIADQRVVPYRYYSAVAEKKIDWLWYPYIPIGKITLLQGDPGDGKSTFMLNLVACLTKGSRLPDGAEVGSVMNVIYQCAEDSISDTIKPRLIQAGADCKHIAFIEDETEILTLNDVRIEQSIQAIGAKLLILDPVQAFVPPDADMQNAIKMRGMMRKLAALAEKTACAIVLVGHMNKASGGKKLYRALGSIDIAAIARSILMISRDISDPTIRYMYPIKSNLAPEGVTIGFVMDKKAGFQWIGKCCLPDDDAYNGGDMVEPQSKKERAIELLEIMLSAEDVPSAEIIRRMSCYGIGERTVRSAYKELGAKAYRKDGIWLWRLNKTEGA